MNTAAGTYFDGEVARPHAVALEFIDTDRLRIHGETVAREVNLADVRVSDRLGDIPRFIYLPGGAMIETADNATVDAAIGDRQRTRGSRLIHGLESRRWIAVVGCVVLLAAIVSLGFYGPPTLARVVAKRVPHDIDERIGSAALASIRPYFGKSALTKVEQERVQRQLVRLQRQPGVPPARLEYLSMNGGLPNAFALPGDIIVVTDELVRLPATDDEIAAVLAHELGHLQKRHGLQSLLRNSFAVLIVAAVTGDMSTLTSFAGTVPMTILTAGYSRDLEREADHYALDLLRARGIKPRAFVTVLVKLEASRDSQHRASTYLSTHPSSDERMALFGGITPAERNAVLVEPWLAQAREAYARSDYPSALVDYDKVIGLAPSADNYLQRARCRRATHDPAGALADLDQALKQDPKLYGAYVTRTEILTFDVQKYDDAISAATQAIALEPQSATMIALRGWAEMHGGKLPEANHDLEKAIALSPSDAHGWAYRAVLKEQKKDVAGALADFNQALKVAPQALWVYGDRGQLRVRQKDFKGALADFEAMTDPAWQGAAYFASRGWAKQNLGEVEGAVADYRTALDRAPPADVRLQIHICRAGAYIALRQYPAALSDCEAALSLNDHQAEAYFQRAVARQHSGDAKSAQADLDRAERLGFDQQRLLEERGEVKWDLGEYSEALDTFTREVTEKPDAHAYAERGLVEFSLGQWDRAETDLEACLKLAPPGQRERYMRFFLLLARRSNKRDDQREALRQAVEKWPEGWTKTVGRYLTGQINGEQLLASVKNGTTPTRQERECEAYFYLGIAHRLAGENGLAEDFFQKCRHTQMTDYYEYRLAAAELRRLREAE